MALMRPSRLPESSRAYTPGDPINLIDWKAYARTDHLLLRETRDEATARVRIFFDIGESMQWPREHLDGMTGLTSKAEVASRCALNLAYAHHRLGDLVELWPVLPGQLQTDQVFRPRSGSDILSLYDRLLQTGFAAEEWPSLPMSMGASERDVDQVYWLGDALGPLDYLASLRKGRLSVMVHVLSSLELGIDWIEQNDCYFDTSQMLKEYQGFALLSDDAYQKRLRKWQSHIADNLAKLGGEYILVSEQSSVAQWHQFIGSLSLKLR